MFLVNPYIFAGSAGTFYELETHIETTSGTSHDFTGLPAGLNEMFAVLDGVGRTLGTGDDIMQLGDSGGIEATGYVSALLNSDATTYTLRTDTTGTTTFRNSGLTTTGLAHYVRLDGNEWVADHVFAHHTDFRHIGQGGDNKTLSAELDRLRLTGDSGASGTYDAGFIGLMHAGA